MVSNQVLQTAVDGFCGILHTKLCVCSADGEALASAAEMKRVSEHLIQSFAVSGFAEQEIGGMSFYRVSDEFETEYIVISDGTGEKPATEAKLFGFQLKELLIAYKDRIDKEGFVKNLLLDNLLLVDIYSRAKKLHIDASLRRVVYTVEAGGSENAAFEAVRALFSARPGDFVTTVDEETIVVIKEVYADGEETAEELLSCAREIRSAVSAAGSRVRIAYGNVVGELREVSRSYKEAKLALDVSRIFYKGSDIIGYNRLGIGRLIYQLPMNLCRMYLREALGGRSPEEFDEETLATIRQFFENNLNISETSRKLFIHRNTLVYRIDKIQKMTGLDLRVFDEAITFQIALMVVEYMEYMEKNEYR